MNTVIPLKRLLFKPLIIAALASAIGFAPAIARAENGPALFMLAVGVNDYQRVGDLRYASQDAKDVAELFRSQRGKMFGHVEVVTLTDHQATADNILQALNAIENQATENSYAIIYLAGHGGRDVYGDYFYLPHDFDPARRDDTAIDWKKLQTALQQIPGKTLLILDTCHAAGAAGNSTQLVIPGQTMQLPNNAVVIASCLANQLSGEKAELNNGVFTEAFLEAVSGNADFNKNGIVTLAELDAYVSGRVDEISSGKQQMTIIRPGAIPSSLPISRIDFVAP